ncbi:MAG TPA: HAMP domain-containing sensor histidine kinase [Holophagaceae bacterium]|nr:HAMP domain-containing sensor histidine kinase [Holophagaceae bacterium]
MALEVRSPGGPFPETYFAPAARANPEELQAAAQACLADPVAAFFIQAAGGLVMILDGHRQVLAVNSGLEALLGADAPSPLGRRPGELFGCIHAKEGPNGCGTSQACTYCGAVLTVLACQAQGGTLEGECQLALERDGKAVAAEYRVVASELVVGPHRFVAVVLQDQGDAKRREVLERLFFHDIANLMQGIRGWTELLGEGGVPAQVVADKLLRLTDLLDRELRSHQDLALAESGHLKAELRQVRPAQVLSDVQDLLRRHPHTRRRQVSLAPGPEEPLRTDPTLLTRVLLNMAINAVEATPDGAWISLGIRRLGTGVRLEVRNPGEIPPELRSRIFLRSFSTKGGSGRGLGTYSMKLFGENVLGGRVDFHCGNGETTFFIDLPTEGGH